MPADVAVCMRLRYSCTVSHQKSAAPLGSAMPNAKALPKQERFCAGSGIILTPNLHSEARNLRIYRTGSSPVSYTHLTLPTTPYV